MQTIGLIGGMSWESSAVYYRDLNVGVQQRLGGLSSPKVVLSTVDFAEVTHLEDEERWQQIGELLAEAAQGVERAGADFLLMCTTTFHKVADQVEAAVGIPLVHLADVVAEACVEQGVTDVGFIGTTVAMEDGFFTDRLANARGEGDRAGAGAPRVAQRRHLRGARARQRPAPHPPPRGRDHRRPLGRRRRRRTPRLHRARAARSPSRTSSCPLFPCTTLHVEAALDRALA